MIAYKIENSNATVRIHDEFCDTTSTQRMQLLNRIVTDHYKRKYIDLQEGSVLPNIEQQSHVNEAASIIC